MYYILHTYEGTTKKYKLHHTYNRNYGGRSALRLPIDGCGVVSSFPVLWQRIKIYYRGYLLGTRKGKQIEEQIIHGSFVGSFRIADRHQHHLLPLVVFTPSPSFVGSFRIAHRHHHHHHPSHHHRCCV